MENPNTPKLIEAKANYLYYYIGAVIIYLLSIFSVYIMIGMLFFPPDVDQKIIDIAAWICLIIMFFVVGAAIGVPAQFRSFFAEITRALRFSQRQKKFGAGGSAAFASPYDEWEDEYEPGTVMLGRSVHGGILLGADHDQALITIAASRSGKGEGVIIPNLLTWEGSVICIDPKGTNAAVTMRRRREMGQRVYVVDPFGVVAGAPPAGFNPLSMIDVNAPTAREDIGMVVDALIVPDTGASSQHWDDSARVILAGMIGQLCRTKPGASLPDLRAVLRGTAEEWKVFFEEMANGKPIEVSAAALLEKAGENERGSMMTTVLRHTAWLDSVAVGDVLRRSDFRFADVKARRVTVYAVLPPEFLNEHSRFLRLFVNLMLRSASIGGKAKVPVLLLLDEFYALGRLDKLESASGALAGYGLKLWPFLQNLGQLKELYPKNWQTFFANAGTAQIFGVNDRETADEVTARMGQAAWMLKTTKGEQRVVSKLLEPSELEQITHRLGGLQLILHSGKPPIIAWRMKYWDDKKFKGMWDTDPDHV